MSNNSLQNVDNYKVDYDSSITEIFAKYVGLINIYIQQCVESVFIKNIDYFKYIIYKGLETINHVFNILLLYTKNLSLTTHYTQQSIYYYIEFIGQIGDDNHSFLQLNSKDATLFVYKKSIFEIDASFRKNFASPNIKGSITNNVELLLKIYSNYFYSLINECKLISGENIHLLTYYNEHSNKFSQNLLNLAINKDSIMYYSLLTTIDTFIDNININNKKSINYVEQFVKKIKKYPISFDKLKAKFYNKNNDIKLTNLSYIKYVNWLFI